MKGLTIRPEQTGMKTSLFDLEAEIMEEVWGNEWDEFSVSDVHQILATRRDIAYTTVMTTVVRLFDKELLKRRKDGRRYLYEPIFSRAEFIERTTLDVLESLPPVGRDTAMAYLVDQIAEIDGDELERLAALIEQRRKGKK